MNKIFIISREPAMRLFYDQELTEEGFEVVTGYGAFISERIMQESPDWVVLDRAARMPARIWQPQAGRFIRSSGPQDLKVKMKRRLNSRSGGKETRVAAGSTVQLNLAFGC